jgi:hypothetical protein
MVARIRTVAFQGTEVLEIDVQVQIAGGLLVNMSHLARRNAEADWRVRFDVSPRCRSRDSGVGDFGAGWHTRGLAGLDLWQFA